MGDSTDGSTGGSSIAARSAQADSQDTIEEASEEQTGFFRKVFGALSLNETSSSDDTDAPAALRAGVYAHRRVASEDAK